MELEDSENKHYIYEGNEELFEGQDDESLDNQSHDELESIEDEEEYDTAYVRPDDEDEVFTEQGLHQVINIITVALEVVGCQCHIQVIFVSVVDGALAMVATTFRSELISNAGLTKMLYRKLSLDNQNYAIST